ncbi:hypothetical protein BV95_01428 [Sphingobium chlorophenolicum]|uniref:Uncharacterized protein n=1 Tax=Sphingobium chlorophenolicum TaxID=46429 RepID=A0A081RGP0_SPHCR|nr:hypothetical protein BV95_01428 [Sphingobium chlorophenolicum]
MDQLGKSRASLVLSFINHMIYNNKIGTSHRLDIAGVANSILATLTIIRP